MPIFIKKAFIGPLSFNIDIHAYVLSKKLVHCGKIINNIKKFLTLISLLAIIYATGYPIIKQSKVEYSDSFIERKKTSK